MAVTHVFGQYPWAIERVDIDTLLHPPAWQRDALCREYPHVDFFPKLGEPTEPAKRVCDRCAVKAECLAYALDDNDITAGIWGGTSNKQRKAMRGAS